MRNSPHLIYKFVTKRRAATSALLFVITGFVGTAFAEDAQIIELTQVNCQFVESEHGKNHGFVSTSKEDCEVIHDKSGDERLAASKTLELKPGKYIFRVKNESVEYPLGFYLRGESLLDKVKLPNVSGGGLEKGVSKDYEITLEEGEYVYSCPLNSTLDYKLVVSGS